MLVPLPPLTMSSREIAELTGKEHRNVIRDIRETLEALEEDALKFESIHLDAYGREKPCFNLPKDLTITLISGYNVKMRHVITKRWMELEPSSTQPSTKKEKQRDTGDFTLCAPDSLPAGW